MFVSSMANMSIRIVSVGLLFLLNIQLARMLAPEGFGLLSYTLAWVQVLALIVQFGLPSGLVRSITLAIHESRSDVVRDTLASGFTLMLGLWLGCIAAGFGWWWAVGPPPGGIAVMVPAFVLVLIVSLGPVLAGALRGMGLVIWSQVPEQILRPALVCMALGAWSLANRNLSAVDALWLQVAMVLPAVAVGTLLLLRVLPKVSDPIHARPMAVAQVALPFLLLTVVQGLLQYASILALGHMVPKADLAQFRIALQMSDALNMLIFGISVVIGPRIVELHAKGDWAGLQHLVVLAHRGGTLLLVAPVTVLVLWGEPILRFVFGEGYAAANEPLRILLIGRLLYGIIGFSGLVLSMIGHARVAMWISLAGLVVTLALLVALVPLWGLSGAAWATVVGMLFINALGILSLYRLSGRDMSALKVPNVKNVPQ